MALEILYGNRLSQRETVVFSKIKECIDNGENVLYIVPEQYSFNADKTLLDSLGEKYMHLTETVNFKRLATTVNKTYQSNQLDYIDEETKNLILYKIIRTHSQQLQTIKNRKNNPDSVTIFKNILSECKGYLIAHDTLETIRQKLDSSGFLYQKISDLDFILTEYEKEISKKFRDFEDSFQVLAQTTSEQKLYSGYHIIIDRFVNFSPAEYLVISALLKNAKNMYLTLLVDDFSKKEAGDLFYPAYKTYNHFLKLAKKQEIEVTATCIERSSHSFFADVFDSVPKKGEHCNFSMTAVKSQRDEVRFVIDTIQKKVSDGAMYSDFTVLTGDLSLYENDVEQAFFQAGIPCFLDRKIPLSENPVARIFLNLFSMVLSDYTKENVLEYLKSLCALFDIHHEICIFEELMHRFQIQKQDLKNQKRWQEKLDFLKTQKIFLAEQLPVIEQVYNFFLLPIIENFTNCSNYLEAFRSLASSLKLEFAIRHLISGDDSVFSQETVTTYNTVLNAIKNIDVLLGDEKISTEDYYHLLKQSLELYEVGFVPDSLDAVTVSDIERGRCLPSPYVFIIGMNENVTPRAHVNTTYLSDIERRTILDLTGIELPTSLAQNCDAALSLYRAMLTAEKQLYFVKNAAETDQEKRMPSYIWLRLEPFCEVDYFQADYVNQSEYAQKALMAFENPYKQKLNPQLPPEGFYDQEHKIGLRQLRDQLKKMQEENYFLPDKKLSKRLIDAKYQKQLKSSVSQLEQYQKCGYAYFINYLLKISQREDISYDFRKTGTIIHALFERFSKNMKKDAITWDTLTEEYIFNQADILVPKEIKRNFPELSLFNSRTKYLIQKFKRLFKSAISYIKEHFQSGDFIPFGYEISFGKEGIPPLTILLEDGSVMQLSGVIDRCDVAKNEDKLYIRIIDYKSSPKEFRFALIKDGIQLQLLTYLHTVLKNGGEYLDLEGELLPGAVLYTSFGDSLASFKERPAPDQIKREFQRMFAMKGFILNDDALLAAIDKQLETTVNYESTVCDVKIGKNGKISTKNLLFMEEFKRLLNDCEQTIQSIGSRMMRGDISIHPYRYGTESGCDYCPYSSICMFDSTMHPYRTLSALSKDDYFTTKKEGEENGN